MNDPTPLVPAIAERTNPMNQLAAAAAALLGLTQMFGHLPAPYIVIHSVGSVCLDLQLSSPAAFEAWRTALVIPVENVELRGPLDRPWLVVETVHAGVVIELASHGIVTAA